MPDWISLANSTGVCGTRIQFNYQANPGTSVRKAMLLFTSGNQTELDQQPPPAPTPCAYTFQQTSPQPVGLNGGTVTLNVNTTSNCSWTASTDSPGWISFRQAAPLPGPVR